MKIKTWTTESNARRAARDAGLELDAIELFRDGARWGYRLKDDQMTDQAAVDEIVEPADGTTLRLIDDDNGDYGEVAVADARAMAVRLANEDQIVISLINPTGGDVVEVIRPEPPAAEGNLPEDADPLVEAADDLIEDDHSADVRPEPKAPERLLSRDVLFCVMGVPESGDAVSWAEELAAKVKIPIQLRHRETSEVIQAIDPKSKAARRAAAKAPRAPGSPGRGKPRSNEPDGLTAKLIELATQPGGTTRPQIVEVTGQPANRPWTMMLKNAAERWGYEYRSDRPGVNTIYYLTKIPEPDVVE